MGVLESINLIAGAIKAAFEFFTTSEGQLVVKSWRESSTAWNNAIAHAATWAENLIKKGI